MSPSNLEILAYEDTPLGPLCLRRRSLLAEPGTVVTEITLNHEFLMSSYNTLSERELATGAYHRRAAKCPLPGDSSGLEVLVGGLGLGYTARAALQFSSVGRAEVVEFLPEVLRWTKEGLLPLSGELGRDPRFVPRHGDIYAQLAAPPGERSYDLILIDVDHSPDDRLGEESQPFYTEAGLRAAAAHLAVDGILGVWSYAESSPFADALRLVFATVEVVPVRFHNRMVDREEVDWVFFASDPRG